MERSLAAQTNGGDSLPCCLLALAVGWVVMDEECPADGCAALLPPRYPSLVAASEVVPWEFLCAQSGHKELGLHSPSSRTISCKIIALVLQE